MSEILESLQSLQEQMWACPSKRELARLQTKGAVGGLTLGPLSPHRGCQAMRSTVDQPDGGSSGTPL